VSWPVYSTRFVEANTGTGWFLSYVPLGYVAILKYASCANTAAGAGVFGVFLHNAFVYRSSVPGGGSVAMAGMHAVAYEDEQVGFNLSVSGMQGHISGYLIKVPPGAVPTAQQTLHQVESVLEPLPLVPVANRA
jgi:hypothetical protein